MPKVNLPMASWEDVIMSLEEHRDVNGWLVQPLINEIKDQVYSQEC